jgi:hypothetical protein
MTKVEGFVFVIRLVIVAPIAWYLYYKVLVMIDATELMWFLFWMWLPISLLLIGLEKMVGKGENKGGT